MNILIDDKKVNFTDINLPALVHGADKTGASFFSICLLANLSKAGIKTLLFSAYPAAKEEFSKQILGYEHNAIIINSGEEEALIEALQSTSDLNERVVLIKNIEHYSSSLFKAVQGLKLIIFSGNLDKCEFADNLINMNLSSKILFSPSEKYPQYSLTGLPKYHGKIVSDMYNGVVSLDMQEL
jgi:hypothetical protein